MDTNVRGGGGKREFRNSPLGLTLMFSIPFAVIGSIILVSVLMWEVRSIEISQQSELRESARSIFDLVLLTRKWNAMHGGVYVEITDETQPNPYLNVSDRDITATDGRRFTMINPAYMTRQMSEMAVLAEGVRFRLSSLKPVNPSNLADDWERNAIESFESGRATERTRVVDRGDTTYYSYIAPLIIEKSCLRCHENEGYVVGKIKGALGVDIPFGPYEAMHKTKFKKTIIVWVIVWFGAMLFMTGTTWILSRRVSKGIQVELEHEKLKSAVQLAAATAHELRQPMTVIMGFAELLNDSITEGRDPAREAEVIVEQCIQMNEIIKKMLNITMYKTMSYDETTEIFDLDIKKEGDDEIST